MLGDCSFYASRPLCGALRLRGASVQNLTAKKSTVTALTEECHAASTAVVSTARMAIPDIPLAYFYYCCSSLVNVPICYHYLAEI